MAVQMEYEKDVKVAALNGKKIAVIGYVHKDMRMHKTCVTQVMMSSSVYVQVNHSIKQKKMVLIPIQ